ncbi:MAG: hypothetical protein KGQ59_03915 [Bdellovibrionales bacterium]|nr:hypothetical protein [Bdellovibrionales bacterium]
MKRSFLRRAWSIFALLLLFSGGLIQESGAREVSGKSSEASMQVSVMVLPGYRSKNAAAQDRCVAIISRESKQDPMDQIDSACLQARIRERPSKPINNRR